MKNIQNFIYALLEDSFSDEEYQLSVYPVENGLYTEYWVAKIVDASAPNMPIFDGLEGNIQIYAHAKTMKKAIKKLDEICAQNMI